MTKASRTHAALLRAALELFEERGYDATTAAAIAGRAGVTEMTFFRHFASKDAVLVDDPYDPLIAEAVARQSAELSPLAAVVAGVREAWGLFPLPQRLRCVIAFGSFRGLPLCTAHWHETAPGPRMPSRGRSDREGPPPMKHACCGGDDRRAERRSAGPGRTATTRTSGPRSSGLRVLAGGRA